MLLSLVRVNLNAVQENLLDQLELPEDISIKEIVKELERIEVADKDLFVRKFNEEILNSTIEVLKNMV
ncbi:hypothetical protein [Clostridium sp.]|uniref:hypothetical protein n=1 Tax=Clostridium sp. TaxID=1506 RepID=UPI0025C6E4E3|nr:hypothetical protein [Clostridium sp.]